jgi:hypothetical protein
MSFLEQASANGRNEIRRIQERKKYIRMLHVPGRGNDITEQKNGKECPVYEVIGRKSGCSYHLHSFVPECFDVSRLPIVTHKSHLIFFLKSLEDLQQKLSATLHKLQMGVMYNNIFFHCFILQ